MGLWSTKEAHWETTNIVKKLLELPRRTFSKGRKAWTSVSISRMISAAILAMPAQAIFERPQPIAIHYVNEQRQLASLPSIIPPEVRCFLSRGEKLVPFAPLPSLHEVKVAAYHFMRGFHMKPLDGLHPLHGLKRPKANVRSNEEPLPSLPSTVQKQADAIYGDLSWQLNRFINSGGNRRNRSVLTRVDKAGWNWLQQNIGSFIDVPSDKNMGTVILSSQLYVEFANDLLKKRCSLTTYPSLEQRVRSMHVVTTSICDIAVCNNVMSAEKREFILQPFLADKLHIPLLRVLVKIHKVPVKGRGLTAGTRWVLSGISSWLVLVLKPFLALVNTRVHNSYQVLQALGDLSSDDPHNLATADISDLYNSIDQVQLLLRIKTFIARHWKQPKSPLPFIEVVGDLIRVIFQLQFVQFGSDLWHQHEGIATGNSASGVLADIYLAVFDEAIHASVAGLIFAARYLDDYLFVLDKSSDASAAVHVFYNFSSDLQLELVSSGTNVNYLDLDIRLHRSNRPVFSISTFFKPGNNFEFVPQNSKHPKHVCVGIVMSQLVRLWRTNNSHKLFSDSWKFLRRKFIDRGYCAATLDVCLDSFYAKLKNAASPKTTQQGKLRVREAMRNDKRQPEVKKQADTSKLFFRIRFSACSFNVHKAVNHALKLDCTSEVLDSICVCFRSNQSLFFETLQTEIQDQPGGWDWLGNPKIFYA